MNRKNILAFLLVSILLILNGCSKTTNERLNDINLMKDESIENEAILTNSFEITNDNPLSKYEDLINPQILRFREPINKWFKFSYRIWAKDGSHISHWTNIVLDFKNLSSISIALLDENEEEFTLLIVSEHSTDDGEETLTTWDIREKVISKAHFKPSYSASLDKVTVEKLEDINYTNIWSYHLSTEKIELTENIYDTVLDADFSILIRLCKYK